MASNDKDSHASPGTAVAELLPDPTGDLSPAPIADADDLIASIADQQIDALISDAQADDVTPSQPIESGTPAVDSAAELAEQATQELAAMAQELNEQVTADLVADLASATREATASDHAAKALEVLNEAKPGDEPIAPPGAEAALTAQAATPIEAIREPEGAVSAGTAVEDVTSPALADVAVEAGASASEAASSAVMEVATNAAPPPESNAAVAEENQTAAQTSAEPVAPAAAGAMPLAPPDAEINQAEIAALIADGNAHRDEKPLHHAADVARSLESGAEEVARELAQEAAAVAAHLPDMPTAERSRPVRNAVGSSALALLSLINFPLRNLPDSAREVIGIVAIVTLVNAMSLLLYLMIFR